MLPPFARIMPPVWKGGSMAAALQGVISLLREGPTC